MAHGHLYGAFRVVAVASAAAMCAILYVGVGSVLRGAMTAGDLLVFISYLRSLNKPIRHMAKVASPRRVCSVIVL